MYFFPAVAKLNFQESLLQLSVLHDPSGAQEIFMLKTDVLLYSFVEAVMLFSGFFDE